MTVPAHSRFMKHNKLPHDRNHQPTSPTPPAPVRDLSQTNIDFVPSPDEVARRAYFTYVNQGSLPGRDVQHWLDAEAELIAERNLTRVHGFHNRT